MSINERELERLIAEVHSTIQHRDATDFRLSTIADGGPAPTIGSDDDTRVFAFGPNIATAAYTAQFRPLNIGELRQDLAAVVLLSEDEFQALSTQARQVPRYRGLSKLFSRRPEEGLRAVAWLESVDVSAVHAILSGIDAELGSTPRNEFTNLGLSTLQEPIAADLQRLTGWPIAWISPERVNAHFEAVELLDQLRGLTHTLEADVERAAQQLAKEQAEAVISKTDISVLDRITDSRLRLAHLQHLTLRQIANSSVAELTRIDGVGEKTATQAIGAARTYCADVLDSQQPQINYQDKQPSTPYVVALARLLLHRDAVRDVPEFPMRISRVESDAMVAVAGNDDLLSPASFPSATPPLLSDEEAWNLYAIRAAEFHAYGDTDAGTNIPDEIAQRVEDISLEGTIHASLRGYQAFGAKFALAQKKVLIGDEMGLGKTMQALAVMTHAAANGKTKALVVCPPSLRINWARET